MTLMGKRRSCRLLVRQWSRACRTCDSEIRAWIWNWTYPIGCLLDWVPLPDKAPVLAVSRSLHWAAFDLADLVCCYRQRQTMIANSEGDCSFEVGSSYFSARREESWTNPSSCLPFHLITSVNNMCEEQKKTNKYMIDNIGFWFESSD